MREKMHGSCHRCIDENATGPICRECYDALREWWLEMWEDIDEVTAVVR